MPTNALKMVFPNELSLANVPKRLRDKRLKNLMTRGYPAEHMGTSSSMITSRESGATPKMEWRYTIAEWLAEPLPDWIETLNAEDIGQRIKRRRKA